RGRTIHDARVGLDRAVARERRAAAGVEFWIVLEDTHRRDDRVERGIARGEDGMTALGGRAHACTQSVEPLGFDVPGAAVDDDHSGVTSAAQRNPTITWRAPVGRPCPDAPRPTPA